MVQNDVQPLLVTILFLAAVAYLGRLVYQSFKGKAHCASGCNACSSFDPDKVLKKVNRSTS